MALAKNPSHLSPRKHRRFPHFVRNRIESKAVCFQSPTRGRRAPLLKKCSSKDLTFFDTLIKILNLFIPTKVVLDIAPLFSHPVLFGKKQQNRSIRFGFGILRKGGSDRIRLPSVALKHNEAKLTRVASPGRHNF